ncbi:MAG: TAT-variant-translocated molybdopterin oxidoreductase [Candidatus Marinimicrobia bacterium]|nr:TAT-variant-translocated molybdopterin oxidoreductase [Candidatus Neomarinimicrobiota bacterium]MBT3630129.1 TAT-variant-translocated molybdopterin oxidoreductase [Candidatus Neomarinimicrobiota bacterium]MBT3826081.1 TAT-variant-translocated molybdopterin oxidoreductase [Candidatus Neomarinimicrobiota bacterium]MBT4132115.1 TAT-variant-translocated molybdopterin oxidoreductase [Candidatus Neomarinimicrobiota bacterium]MBT4296602.1 TAT-variant-translocated molybdopterin oxidoreductase [Candi
MSNAINPSTQGKKYWRSLDHLAETPEFKELVEKEFPEGADELKNPVSRRKFLGLMGASMALAGLTSCRRPVEKIIPYVVKPEEIIPGKPQYYATSMPFGNESFGLLVESHEGRPTKIEGNKLHPASGGSSNVFMQAEMLNLYDPDRSQMVLNKGKNSTWSSYRAAWKKQTDQYTENGGEGLAILSESFTSPTMMRLSKAFKKKFPQAQWVTYDSVSDENVFAGVGAATGTPAQPRYNFKDANVVLSLDSDFLQMDSNDIPHARDFASRRKVRSEKDSMNRLYVVEGTYTITGGMADHRLRVQSGQVGMFAAALAHELSAQGLNIRAPRVNANFDKKWISAVAKDLIHNKGNSLVLGGRRQPAEVHTLIALINDVLSNTNKTVSYTLNPDMQASSLKSFVELGQAMNAGKVESLIILGGNPVYQAPADVDFLTGLTKVKYSVHLSSHVDETSAKTTWHIPEAHFLESWGDVSGYGGVGVIQPLIAPLFDGKSNVDVLADLVADEEVWAYGVVQETWKDIIGSSNFEKAWRKVVHDGFLASSRESSVAVNKTRAQGAVSMSRYYSSTASAGDMEVIFTSSFSNHDGRYANNGWMQELPDPVTKLTWDNVALISANTAMNLGVKNEDRLKISSGGVDVVLPVWIQPGMADNTLALELGYGREIGRVSTGVGANVSVLRNASGMSIASGFSAEKAFGTHTLACVQDNHGFDEEKLAAEAIQERLPTIVRESTLADYQKDPEFAMAFAENNELKSMWKEHDYSEGNQWGMSIDLTSCTGCSACTIACQSENNIPVIGKEEVNNGRDMSWIRLDRYYTGDVEDPEMVFQPIACQHCELAPCEGVCPVAATTHSEEGLNEMAYNRCIGTRYCANNCPYKVRRFNFFNFTKDMPEIVQMAMNPDVSIRFRGVMEKCTFCVQRINVAKIEVKNEGRELEESDIVVACQQACPTDAIAFGNINDPNSEVSKIKAQNRDYSLLGELNLKPRTSYGAKLRNPNPELESGHAAVEHTA